MTTSSERVPTMAELREMYRPEFVAILTDAKDAPDAEFNRAYEACKDTFRTALKDFYYRYRRPESRGASEDDLRVLVKLGTFPSDYIGEVDELMLAVMAEVGKPADAEITQSPTRGPDVTVTQRGGRTFNLESRGVTQSADGLSRADFYPHQAGNPLLMVSVAVRVDGRYQTKMVLRSISQVRAARRTAGLTEDPHHTTLTFNGHEGMGVAALLGELVTPREALRIIEKHLHQNL